MLTTIHFTKQTQVGKTKQNKTKTWLLSFLFIALLSFLCLNQTVREKLMWFLSHPGLQLGHGWDFLLLFYLLPAWSLFHKGKVYPPPLWLCHTCQHGVEGWGGVWAPTSQYWFPSVLWWEGPCPTSIWNTHPHNNHPLRCSCSSSGLQQSCSGAASSCCGIPSCWSQGPMGFLSPSYLLYLTQEPRVFSDGHAYPFRDAENSR